MEIGFLFRINSFPIPSEFSGGHYQAVVSLIALAMHTKIGGWADDVPARPRCPALGSELTERHAADCVRVRGLMSDLVHWCRNFLHGIRYPSDARYLDLDDIADVHG